MIQTRVTKLLEIRHPIMQGGMHHIGTPELAAAVSEAGGLGTINAAAYPSANELREAVRDMKQRTNHPFAVNLSLIPELQQNDLYFQQLRVMAEEGVPVVETAGSNPQEFVSFFKEHGMKWIHKASAVKHALKAEELGADIVTLVGYEVGGHPGKDEVGSTVLVRHAAQKCRIPILAAGGYVDGPGLASALALGAEGITMGTRFVASKEACLHPNFKNWILRASENDTVICQRSIHNMMRAANNEAAKKCLNLERRGASLEELMTVISGQFGKTCYASGDVDGCIFPIGMGAGLIEQILPVREIVEGIVSEAEAVIAQLCGRIQPR